IEVLRSMQSALRASLPPEVEFEFDLTEGLPAVEGDQTQLWQVVYNVAVNAGEALEDGAGWIRVSSRPVSFDPATTALRGERDHLPAGDYVEVVVEDSGRGLTSEAAERLFEPFFSTRFQGRGLGLPAAQGIMHAHGGAILFDGDRQDGAAFHLLFPRATSEAIEVPAVEPPAPTTRRPTILLADDEEIVRRAGTRLLEALDYAVIEAGDGEAALEAWESHRDEVDLVILDVTMPRMDGREALVRLRERAPDLKVLLTSGFQPEDVLSEGAVPDGFVAKPFRLKQVREQLEAVLEGVRP
ncbi:MAG: response regulator, partial [Longimicrobiales bacterium]